MTAQGEDVLAWLEAAITAREKAAQAVGYERFVIDAEDPSRGTKTIGLRRGNLPKAGPMVFASLAEYIVLNDPASVLRCCAADRKLIAEVRRTAVNAKCQPNSEPYAAWAEAMRRALETVAEGYGWTGEQR